MKHNVLISLYILIFSLLTASCVDDIHFDNGVIPEGDGTLSATVTFTPVTTSDLGISRTAGDTINSIESLCVLVYHKDKTLFKKFAKTDLKNYEDKIYTVDPDKDHLDGNEAHTDEKTTASATFQIPEIPFGRYYIFAVANMGDLSDYDSEIQTVEGLQKIKL